MKDIKQFATQCKRFMVVALVLLGFWPNCVLAQDSHNAQSHPDLTGEQKNKQLALLKIAQGSTLRLQNVSETDRIPAELAALGKPGFTIARARLRGEHARQFWCEEKSTARYCSGNCCRRPRESPFCSAAAPHPCSARSGRPTNRYLRANAR